MDGSETFNLSKTIASIEQAIYAVVGNIIFAAALHGLTMAIVVLSVGSIFFARKQRFGKPLMAVGTRVALICLVLMAPGTIALITSGHLPPAGVFNVSSLGFIVFWSLVLLHLSAEEMNHQWF